jgi:hypothetical protein
MHIRGFVALLMRGFAFCMGLFAHYATAPFSYLSQKVKKFFQNSVTFPPSKASIK